MVMIVKKLYEKQNIVTIKSTVQITKYIYISCLNIPFLKHEGDIELGVSQTFDLCTSLSLITSL
jgi:hypothetical protein